MLHILRFNEKENECTIKIIFHSFCQRTFYFSNIKLILIEQIEYLFKIESNGIYCDSDMRITYVNNIDIVYDVNSLENHSYASYEVTKILINIHNYIDSTIYYYSHQEKNLKFSQSLITHSLQSSNGPAMASCIRMFSQKLPELTISFWRGNKN